MCGFETARARPHRIGSARLLERVFDIDMQRGPNCEGGALPEIKVRAAGLFGGMTPREVAVRTTQAREAAPRAARPGCTR